MSKTLYRLLPPVVNILLTLLVYSIIFTKVNTYAPQIDWTLDFHILIISLIALELICLLPLPRKYTYLLFALRTAAIVIIAIPYPHTTFIDSFLITGLSLSLISRINLRFAAISSLVLMGVYLVVKILSGYVCAGILISIWDTVFFMVFYVSFNFLYLLSRFSIDRDLQREKEIIQLKGTISQLTEESSHLLNYAAHAEESSSNEERKRITRELHDIIGKTFTDIIMMMEANVRNTPDDEEELRQIFSWVGAQSRLGLGQIREVLYDLRSSIREESIELRSLGELTGSFHDSTDIAVELVWANSRLSYGKIIDSTIYRIVQEALINTLRHSNADSVRISLWDGGSELEVTVQDNGSEQEEHQMKGLGQTGMEERLEDLDGSILFKRNREGYLVRVTIPLARKEICHV